MGRIVHTEAQNSFRLEGATVTISGKPDLIITSASDPTYVLIIDVKTGQECPSHAAQLMIYLYALPKALQQYRDAKIRGEAFYPTRTHVVGRGSLDQGFIRRLVALIQRIAAEPPPTHRQRVRVPFLRHHSERLPRPPRRLSRAHYRRHDGLLTSSWSTSATQPALGRVHAYSANSLSPRSTEIS